MAAEKQKTFSILPKVINGNIAGFVAICCVFPLDLVKTRMQNQVIGPSGERMYKSILDTLVKTYKKDGFFGMYQGAFINIIFMMPEKAVKLSVNDMFRFKLKKEDGSLPLGRQILAATGSSVSAFICCPMELFKIQMQDQGRLGKAKLRTRDVIRNIYRKNGFFGFYQGFIPTWIRDVLFSIIYFTLFFNIYEFCPRTIHGEEKAWCSLACGCAAGGTAAFLLTPVDVIKTRLQTLQKGQGEETYSSVPDAFKRILTKEGWRALYKGGACRVMVIAPLFGITQLVYYLGIAEFLLGIKTNA
ncbi:unnamed protein product [Phyllotreta striolata]|uniref:Uncharacterized protein n=1 Tax=Phyllotreta striolata TaxID=444603 RepID=A0A9N9TQ05_PHYSR|nr:unnamed protein product [Phyllotreta striolata]